MDTETIFKEIQEEINRESLREMKPRSQWRRVGARSGGDWGTWNGVTGARY